MKKHLFVLGFLFTGLLASAQQKGTAAKDPNKQAAGVARVSPEATVTGFESNLASGNLSLVKTLSRTTSGSFNTSYFLTLKGTAYNAGKPYQISLTRDAFDAYFQRSSNEVAQKWKDMLQFVQSGKLSLTDETGWTKAVNYFNSL